jgi:putative ABC transport system permease protein
MAVGAGGALLGLTGAMAGSRLIEQWFRARIAYAPASTLVALDPALLVIAAGFAIGLALIAGLAPAARAARLDPVVAFRTQAAY